jgi:hypothetical protein
MIAGFTRKAQMKNLSLALCLGLSMLGAQASHASTDVNWALPNLKELRGFIQTPDAKTPPSQKLVDDINVVLAACEFHDPDNWVAPTDPGKVRNCKNSILKIGPSIMLYKAKVRSANAAQAQAQSQAEANWTKEFLEKGNKVTGPLKVVINPVARNKRAQPSRQGAANPAMTGGPRGQSVQNSNN